MRTLIGMIFGCFLTIATVYIHDSMAPSAVASSPAGAGSRAIVNWDVAASEWGHVEEGVRTAWLKLKTSINS